MSIHGRRGVTFLELMVVMMILGIMLAIVIPNLSGPRAKMALRTASRDMAAAGMLARHKAITQGEQTYFIVNGDDGTWRIHYSLPDERASSWRRRKEQFEPQTSEEQPRNLPETVSYKRIDVDHEEVPLEDEYRMIFYPNGTCSGMAIQIVNSRDKTLTIDFEAQSGLPAVYQGKPKTFAEKLRESGLDPAKYGITEDGIAGAGGSRPGEGFYLSAGMSKEERINYYADISERIKAQAERQYRVKQDGVGVYYSEAARWGN